MLWYTSRQISHGQNCLWPTLGNAVCASSAPFSRRSYVGYPTDVGLADDEFVRKLEEALQFMMTGP